MKLLFIIFFSFFGVIASAQDSGSDNSLDRTLNIKDSPANLSINQMSISRIGETQQRVSIGGIFIAPYFGFVFPMRSFGDNSNTGISYGAKIEFAHTKIYPIVIGGFFEQQKHKGDEEFKAIHRLSTFNTDITSIGGGADVILNKYIRSNFTIPFLILEAKFMNVSRIIEPRANVPDIPESESLIGYTAGLGFTLYIFDLSSKYTFAKEFSGLSINIRARYPIIKF